MKHNQLGFNNFKSFGDRIQMFSDKPITLVYSANSVGKSSFLHAQLYKEYLKRSRSIEFERSDFAGDELAIDGFDEFVHKKDTLNKISFRKIVSSPKDLDLILGDGFSKIKEFAKEGIIEEALLLDSDDFVKRLNNYKLKEDEWLFTDSSRENFKQYMAASKALRHILREVDFIDYIDNSEDFKQAFRAMFGMFSLFNEGHHSKKISLEDFKSAMKSKTHLRERLVSKNGENFDRLDDILIFIIGYSEPLLSASVTGSLMANLFGKNKNNIGKFFDGFKRALTHFERVSEIDSITFDLIHGKKTDADNVKLAHSVDITVRINNSIIVAGQFLKGEKIKAEVTDEGELFLKNLYKVRCRDDVLKRDSYYVQFLYLTSRLVRKITDGFEMPSVNEVGWSILNMFPHQEKQDTVNVYMEVFVENLLKMIHQNYFNEPYRTIQYFGPLRVYPNKSDLVVSQQEEIYWEEFLQEDSIDEAFIKNYCKDLNYWVFKRSPKLAIILKIIPKFFTVRYWRLIFRELSVADSINFFKKMDNKISYGSANSASKLWKYLISSEELQQEMNYWLLDDSKLKSTYELKTEEITEESWLRKIFFLKGKKYKALKFIDKSTGVSVTPREMGLGISQFLPILLATKVLKESTQYIEQPELHLHPALQCEVADEFIRSMNTQNNKFYIETHSEHLLLRIMKRLRYSSEGLLKKGDALYLTPDDVCLLYVDNNGEFTYLNELELDEDGSLLDPWPNGFFEEGLNEMFT